MTELSFLELRHGRIYTELGGDVTDELVAAVDAAAAEVSVAYHAKVQYMLALIRQMRQRGITASELDELELALVNLATDHITSADPGSDCKDWTRTQAIKYMSTVDQYSLNAYTLNIFDDPTFEWNTNY